MTPYYDDGEITIYHGDCREVLPQLSGVDLVVTSPPYNLGQPGGTDFVALDTGYGLHDDSMPHEEYVRWQREVVGLAWKTLTPAGAIFYNHKPRPHIVNGLKLPLELIPDDIPIRQIITWDRGAGHIRQPTMFVPSYEWILLLAKPEFRLLQRNNHHDVWRVPFETNNPHPAPFPVSIPRRCIDPTSAKVVLDPFMGSGTTLAAARECGRAAVGIELEERWCEYSAQRLAQGVLEFG